jgi:hypothetical protein
VTRSSFERVALMRESLAQLDLAMRLAGTPARRALVHANRAHHLVTWGFPREALQEFDLAEAEEPGAWRAVADGLSERLRHPVRPDPGPPSPPAGTDRP